MKNIGHENIIECLAAIRKGNNRYFMFPWANGDSLRDFWKKTPKQAPSRDLIDESVRQIYGLADALYRMHNYAGSPSNQTGDAPSTISGPEINVEGQPLPDVDGHSIRHGDLKPDNILRFLETRDMNAATSKKVGTLKIADMGLTKHHVIQTQDRSAPTETRRSTYIYQAPEAEGLQALSRLYDIWSMGCIIFEFVIWLLYGHTMIDKLYDELGDSNQSAFHYFEKLQSDDGPGTKIDVHRVASSWIDHIQKHDPECKGNSALADLLNLVKEKLLVVDLPPRRPSAIGKILSAGPVLRMPHENNERRHYRATAETLRDSLKAIVDKLVQENYTFTGNSRESVLEPGTRKLILTDNTRRHSNEASGLLNPKMEANGRSSNVRITNPDYSLPPLDQWQFPVDETFADKVLTRLGVKAFKLRESTTATLCSTCKQYNFWRGGFSFSDRTADLCRRSRDCGLCHMLWTIHRNGENPKSPTIRFERDGSTMKLPGSRSLPVLSILRSSELKPPTIIQLGLPELFEPGTMEFFQLIELWLQDCDDSHPDCCVMGDNPLPTRLIDVGTAESPELRLIETHETTLRNERYVALSHPWGNNDEHPPFCTLRNDRSGQGRELAAFKCRIPEEELPATFRDAVVTTRSIHVRYLWIDSLCILQGDDGDFEEESQHMETVFSSAHCVLAASRATDQHDGFLKPLSPRKYLTIQRGNEQPFYICEWIDDFSKHVLEGSLNQRGWVLQERALARRTIYFTKEQTYFECGNGIRTQSLTKMHHNMVDFLGDPRFPSKAMNSKRGLKIVYFQELYRQYSRLAFTHIQDKPFAIKGLENRLQSAYKTQGGYGIFDDGQGNGLFHRSLLWRRSEESADANIPWLYRIPFPPGRNVTVPTWSWMAYQGGIDYLAPPFDKTDWETNDIQPPWTGSDGSLADGAKLALKVTVRDYNVAGSHTQDFKFIYDTDRSRADDVTRKVRCVVVARSKERQEDAKKTYYVLLVEPLNNNSGDGNYFERVGAGFMLGRFIARDTPGIRSMIQ
ncbi:HET-domain-containing protein [Astrocystis sublimbata]|nr:HET-domain-containing protein [Astrocystis sublimbata]